MASKKFETLDGLSSTGDVIISGNVAIDTDTLYVDSVNNRVGIGKTNPSTLLDVDGNITATNVNATFHGDGSNVTSVNATALGGLSNTQFLRSDTSDSFTSGTLTLSGSAVSITSGNLRLANNIPLRIGTSDSPGGSIQFNPTGNTVQINGSNVNFDTATLFVDTTNNRVGVGKTNPATALDISGTVTATAFTGDSTIVRTSRNINTSGIATGGGNLSADRTINVPATNLGNVANSTALQVTSSTGTDTNLPAASGSAWGVVTTGSQTFGGTKTFSGVEVNGRAFANSFNSGMVTVSPASTVDLNFTQNTNFEITLDQNVTFTFTIDTDCKGQSGMIIINQDGVGGRTFTLPASAKTPVGGASIAQQTASGSTSIINYFVVSTTIVLVNYIGNFQ